MSTEADFYKKSEEWLYRLLERNPVEATFVGDHRWDSRLADNTLEALENDHQDMLSSLAEFEAFDTAGFGLDARIDHTLMVQIIKSSIRRYEKVEEHLRDPVHYLDQVMGGVFHLIMKEFAPLPERLRSVLGRLREAPRVLREAELNIRPSKVPPVWAEIALEQAKQSQGLLTGLLPSMAAQAAPDLEADFREAGQAAADAMRIYQEFLEKQVLPNAAGDFAAGRDLFDEILREDHMVDYDADELYETGWRLFRDTEEAMKSVAAEIDPDKSVQELLEEAKADHPTAEGLLKANEDAMEAARQYVIDHDIATIPEGESLRIVETPVYLRPLLPYAAYMPPGILEEKQDGIFLVTPVDPDTPPEVQEQKLKGQNYAKMPITALHEAYPGHHLQLVWANRQERIPRRLASYLSSLFIEGWAFYCEELMEELGYIARPIQRLARLKDQLWRAARIILDVSLHTRGMPAGEAVDFLVDACQLEPTNALAEVRRYTGTPTQPQSYLMGKLALLKLVDKYKSANPDVSLRQMHDAILGCGSLPPKLMRERLLGADRE
jgi:uncharacterized protein (DUF885 family)